MIEDYNLDQEVEQPKPEKNENKIKIEEEQVNFFVVKIQIKKKNFIEIRPKSIFHEPEFC